MTDLARRAMACKHWRWMPRMLSASEMCPTLHGLRVETQSELEWWNVSSRKHDPDIFPDLTDPETIDCLLALVREAWEEPLARVAPDEFGVWWHCIVHLKTGASWHSGKSEAAALVAALEAAP